MATQAFSSAYDYINGSSSGDLSNAVANAIIAPFDNNSRYFTNDPSRALRSSARAASSDLPWQMSASEPAPSSGADPTGMYTLYDPNFNSFSASSVSSADADERQKLLESLAPYSTLFGMDIQTAYQEALAGTAHQREVADLKAAGLNPVLSATSGSGASVFSGDLATVLSLGSAGSSGFSPGSGRDGSSIRDKISSLNWKAAASSIGSAVGQAASGRLGSAVGSAVSAAFKLFT